MGLGQHVLLRPMDLGSSPSILGMSSAAPSIQCLTGEVGPPCVPTLQADVRPKENAFKASSSVCTEAALNKWCLSLSTCFYLLAL